MLMIPTSLGDLAVDDGGEAGAPVAMLWPSLFCDHTMWRHQVGALHGGGYRTLALDPPGHGRSPGPGRRFTMDECAAAALEVLDARGVEAPVVFLGTSWGGFVAPRLALRAPERVRALVTFNTSADRPGFADRAKALLLTTLFVGPLHATMAATVAASMLSPKTKRDDPALAAAIAATLASWNARSAATSIRSVLVDRTSVYDALPAIATPTLVVSGKDDPIFPPIRSERLAAALPHGRRVEVADAAHLVPLEAPEKANALILDFLAGLPARA